MQFWIETMDCVWILDFHYVEYGLGTYFSLCYKRLGFYVHAVFLSTFKMRRPDHLKYTSQIQQEYYHMLKSLS